jgi:hypothetical protein
MHRHCPINRSLETGANHNSILYWNEEGSDSPATDKLSVAGSQHSNRHYSVWHLTASRGKETDQEFSSLFFLLFYIRIILKWTI